MSANIDVNGGGDVGANIDAIVVHACDMMDQVYVPPAHLRESGAVPTFLTRKWGFSESAASLWKELRLLGRMENKDAMEVFTRWSQCVVARQQDSDVLNSEMVGAVYNAFVIQPPNDIDRLETVLMHNTNTTTALERKRTTRQQPQPEAYAAEALQQQMQGMQLGDTSDGARAAQ